MNSARTACCWVAAAAVATLVSSCTTPTGLVRRVDVPLEATVQSTLENVTGGEAAQGLVQIKPIWNFALDEDAYLSYQVDTAYPALVTLFWETGGFVHDRRVMKVTGGPASMRLDMFFNLVKAHPDVPRVQSGQALLKFTTSIEGEGNTLVMSTTGLVTKGIGEGLPDLVEVDVRGQSVFSAQDPVPLMRLRMNDQLLRLYLKVDPLPAS